MSTIKLSTKLVKSHFSVVLKQESKNLIDFIMDELKGISVERLHLDPDFLKYIAEVIENQVPAAPVDSECKIKKMDVLVEVLKRLFPMMTES